MTTAPKDRRRDDLAAGLAAVEAGLDAMGERLEEGFSNIEKLLDAKLDPVIQASTEQRQTVADHERRLTTMETVMEKEVTPAIKQVWETKKAVASLEEHARRCDDRNKTSSSRWWGVAQGVILTVASLIIGWLGATFYAGLRR